METDRQTDKAAHWKSAIFDVDDNWSALLTPPAGWTVYKKLEICPTTQKEHYQTHVDCGTQQRLSALTKWLKHTKWIAVRGQIHIKNSIAYISKTETTAPGAKLEISRGEKYMQFDEILMYVAMCAYPPLEDPKTGSYEDSWQRASTVLIYHDIKWVNKLANPALATMWKNYSPAIRSHVEKRVIDEVESGGFIIEPPQAEEVPDECQIDLF